MLEIMLNNKIFFKFSFLKEYLFIFLDLWVGWGSLFTLGSVECIVLIVDLVGFGWGGFVLYVFIWDWRGSSYWEKVFFMEIVDGEN